VLWVLHHICHYSQEEDAETDSAGRRTRVTNRTRQINYFPEEKEKHHLVSGRKSKSMDLEDGPQSPKNFTQHCNVVAHSTDHVARIGSLEFIIKRFGSGI
jgi:hypothetical protein